MAQLIGYGSYWFCRVPWLLSTVVIAGCCHSWIIYHFSLLEILTEA